MFKFYVYIYKRYNVCLIGIGKDRKNMSSLMIFEDDEKNELKESRSSSTSSKASMKSKHASTNSPINRCILLNPEPFYEIEAGDICYYISLVKEENYNWKGKQAKSCIFNKTILNEKYYL